MRSNNIFITGGGTGGHVYPALVIGNALQLEGYSVIYIGTGAGLESKVIPNGTNFKFIKIRATGLRGGFLNKLLSLVFLFINIIRCFFLTAKYKPRFIVGSGGYVSAAVIVAGFLSGVKTYLLEQNYTPGKTTKILSFFARKVFVSFPCTARFLRKGKGVFTGNPAREDILKYTKNEARENLGLDKDRITILVTGASQGAKSINEAVIHALQIWKDEPWQIIHLTGEKNYDDVMRKTENSLASSKLRHKAFAYMDEINTAYACADLVICRSGATTIAEITLRGLPSILVPYPYAAEGHQDYNAAYMEKNNAGIIIKDKNIYNELPDVVKKLVKEKDKLLLMSKNALKLGCPDALKNILAEIGKDIKGSV